MTRRGRPSKKTAAQVKSNRPIEQVGSREPSSTSSPSSPPSSPLSWYGRITAMNFTSPSAAALSNQSSRHSYGLRTINSPDEPASSTSFTTPSRNHSEPSSTLVPARRHQAIPISFLVHPTHVSPKRPSSLSLFSSPPESSSHNTESTPQVTATEHSSSKEVLYDSSVENQGDGASQHDAPLRLSALYNHPYGPSAPSSSRSRHSRVVVEGNRNSTDPADDETAAESTALADDSSIQSASIRRTNNPNVKTTKTGKILHKSKKVGVSRRLTVYDRFLQQRSRQLAVSHPELTPQQRMKKIAEEWAVSDKNQHKTRRKSRFLGPNGELLLPSTSSSSSTSSLNLQTFDSNASSPATSSPTDPGSSIRSDLKSPAWGESSTSRRRQQQQREDHPESTPTNETSEYHTNSTEEKHAPFEGPEH